MASVTRYYPTIGGPTILVQEGVGAQTFKAGDLVMFNASGQVVVSTDGIIHGIAMQNAASVTGTKIQVELIDPNAVYVAYYKAAAITQALVGDVLDFTFTIGGHTLDETGATTDVYVVGLLDPVNTVSGRLLVRFKGTLLTGLA